MNSWFIRSSCSVEYAPIGSLGCGVLTQSFDHFGGAELLRMLQLLNHLVGAGEQCGRDFEAQRLGGVEIDHQLEFSRLYHW